MPRKGRFCNMQYIRQSVLNLCLLITILSFSAMAWTATEISYSTNQGIIKASDLRGQVVYVDFWASWCTPCRKSFPWMNAMQERYGDQGFKIIAVNLDKDRQLVDQFLKTYRANFTIAYDPEGLLASQFGLKGMPGSYLIGRDGQLKLKHLGFRGKDKNKLEMSIKNELKQ